jgi:hypothetical protein
VIPSGKSGKVKRFKEAGKVAVWLASAKSVIY